MTCIVGVVDDGVVYIGGDSAGVSGLDITVRTDQKVFRKGEFVMGFTTSFRMGQLLRYSLSEPKLTEGQDTYAYMVGPFVNAARQCLKDGGWASLDNGVEKGGSFLVGFRGQLFEIASDYQVGESSSGYGAVGCGGDYALGSLHTSRGKPRDRLRTALEAAEFHSAGVQGPFTILATTARGGDAARASAR